MHPADSKYLSKAEVNDQPTWALRGWHYKGWITPEWVRAHVTARTEQNCSLPETHQQVVCSSMPIVCRWKWLHTYVYTHTTWRLKIMLPHDSKGSFSKSSNIVSLSHAVILQVLKTAMVKYTFKTCSNLGYFISVHKADRDYITILPFNNF